MTGAQALVRQLRSEGVDTVFALPGVQVMAALDAFYEVQGDIRLVNTRHEQATTYMADGYAKVTGKVGVALVVPGPGALNLFYPSRDVQLALYRSELEANSPPPA